MALPQQSSTGEFTKGKLLSRLAGQSQVDFELEFFGAILVRHPGYLEMLRVHAKNLITVKRHLEALQVEKRIIQLAPEDSLAHYNLACSYSLLHQADLALKTLRQAVELGYRDFDFMQKDRDLDPIRKDPRFRQLIREYQR